MSNCGNCNDCVACEDRLLCAWIADHPFPSYQDMCKRINNNLKNSFEFTAEYGVYNHNALKIIYNSNMDREVSKKIGQGIYERGGTWALQANCTVFKYCTPLSDAPFPVRALPGMLESYWHGIGEFLM